MHDFLLAKEIFEAVKEISEKKDFRLVTKVTIALGSVEMAHDGMPEHLEEINRENLVFGLESLSKNTGFEQTKFLIKRKEGPDWKIVEFEVE